MSINSVGTFIFALLLSISPLTMAAVQQHTFSITSSSGDTGTGSFTWNDAIVADGQVLNASSSALSPAIKSISINVSGPNVMGGTAVFSRDDCFGAYLRNTPDFQTALILHCDNGVNRIDHKLPFVGILNQGAAELSFLPGTTSAVLPVTITSVPTISTYGLIITVLGVFLFAVRDLSSRAVKLGQNWQSD